MTTTFSDGDPVLLIYNKKHRWIRTISEDQFHCNYGTVELGQLIDQPYGSSLETSKGKWLHALPPTIIDWINVAFKHQSQIIYEKDAGMIIMMLDAKPGDVIYETGTGSGSLTTILARIVGPTGKIITHDNREQAIKAAKYNLGLLSLENVIFNLRDIITDGFVEGQADSVILDMGDPWQVIGHVAKVLKPGRKLVVFIPTFDQLSKTNDQLMQFGFKDIKAIELIEREIQLKQDAIRPSTRMIGHTGYLLSAIFIGN